MKLNKITLSHSGKQHSYQVAKALDDLGCLEKFYTSSYIRSEWLQNFLLRSGDTFWTRRFISGISEEKVEPNWRFEFRELTYARLFGTTSITQQAVYKRDEKFDKYMSTKIARLKSNVFWGFQGSCYESLKSAKVAGKIAVCELSTAHIEYGIKILSEEKKLHPEWSTSLDILDFPANYMSRLIEEPHVADKVIAASRFTKDTLTESGVDASKIIILPLGYDARQVPFKINEEDKVELRPLKLLYVGRITQKKGIKYLLEALKGFRKKEVELHIIGYMHGDDEPLQMYKGLFKLHPPLSQKELFKEYSKYDALILPSIFEGFGLVIVEAMAAGLPVIATPHTMGPDIIEEDKNGYLVPIRDIKAIAKAIEKIRNKSASEFVNMRKAAHNSAMHFSWDAYKRRLKEILENNFSSNRGNGK